MDEPERRKRSRFDQTEPEPRRASRFDRRSRSPPSRKPEGGHERSPLSKGRDSSTPDVKSPLDPAAAAAAAAAKINAELQARKGIQHVDVPAVKSSSTAPSEGEGDKINGEMYISDGDFIKDIEVNDLRNRYLLTKGATQKMIKDDTGADVTTRGSYYPDKSMATPANPPLYLHVTSTSKEGLEKAVAKIEELMKQELPQLVDERRFRRREQEQVERDEYGRRKWPEEKIPINLESLPGFNLRAQVVGHGGAYVKHIQQETGCRVQIKGRGSGYVENATGREAEEDMYLHVTGPDPKMVEKGKELCEDLLENVKDQYEDFKKRPPRHHDRPGGYGDRSGGYGDRPSHYGDRSGGHGDRPGWDNLGGYRDYNNNNNGNGNGSNQRLNDSTPGASHASPAPATAANPAATTDYAAQYAQYYGGADPYAAYGGYQAYMQMYQQWYAAQTAQQTATGGAPGVPGVPGVPGAPGVAGAPGLPPAPGASASPPPPPSEAAPPPPPPPSSAAPPPPPPPGPPGM